MKLEHMKGDNLEVSDDTVYNPQGLPFKGEYNNKLFFLSFYYLT